MTPAIPPPIWPAPTTSTRSNRIAASLLEPGRSRWCTRVMARVLLLVAVVWPAACGGKDEAATPTPSTSTTAASSDEAVLASWTRTSASRLFWADPETLEPSDGRTATVPFSFFAAERSPDGGLLAVGADDRGTVELVDVERMRALGEIDIAGADWVERLHWVGPDLLLASLAGPSYQAAALDPETRGGLGRVARGKSSSTPMAGDSLVFLLAQPNRIGPATRGLRRQQRIRSTNSPRSQPATSKKARRTRTSVCVSPFPGSPSSPAEARAGPPGREPRCRGRPGDTGGSLPRSRRARVPPGPPARLARAGGRGQVDDGPNRNAVWLPVGSSQSAGLSTPPTTRTASPFPLRASRSSIQATGASAISATRRAG